MFFDHHLKQKIALIISNIIFIILSAILYFNQNPKIEEPTTMNIVVYITGEVNKPGLYEIEEDKRLDDLITKAGGLTEKADFSLLNPAIKLSDEMKVVIPSINNNETGEKNNNGKININTASLAELDSLSGIGPAKAQEIINYRELHGPFNDISEIMNVSGIGTKTYESIKDHICI